MESKNSKTCISSSGWLENAKVCESPNFNERPESTEVDLIVIHSISLPPGEYGACYIDDLFTNSLDANIHPYFETIKDLHVSAHLLINRKGELTQYVSFLNRAWHAGQSCYEGRENCNDFSIGIELEGLEGNTFEAEQYESLAKTCIELMKYFPAINPQGICGHSDVAPGRKIDPGSGFDWEYFYKRLEALTDE